MRTRSTAVRFWAARVGSVRDGLAAAAGSGCQHDSHLVVLALQGLRLPPGHAGSRHGHGTL